jgi:serine/threonine protein kinase
MARCVSCSAEVPIASRFCSSCGAPAGSDDATLTAAADIAETIAAPRVSGSRSSSPPISADDVATLEFASAKSSRSARQTPAASPSSSSSRPPSSSALSLNDGRFLPGRLLAGRYRIIALLGKGGMGEVYRADDLTLGQPVALKFLPEEASRDESLLERFRNEVRIARRVSHPNVCRVYDVGEVDGNTFFTMEYVDGEDLASLLRRIGRLPQDKAVDIARQLCAGLAAAHAKGVLHRDLKPANVMLDGRGQVVITDFGLAGLNDQIHGADIRSGTPAYMAPEQIAGKEVSARSDLYSLGLVLYEVFTGKRAFTAEALAELVRSGGASTPSRPSSVVKDLDPAAERAILRCIEPDPRNRPPSALSVAAALPGGDPLAAALAAGETPSPEMVAAAGETSGISPRIAIACLAAILIGLAGAVYLGIRQNGLDRMGAELSPEVLTQKAREMIVRLGYEGRPADSFYDFDYDTDFVNYLEKHDKPRPDWDRILSSRQAPLRFWYRQSPDVLIPTDLHGGLLTPGLIDTTDPPPTLSGMIQVELDEKGRLLLFEAMSPQVFSAVLSATQSATPTSPAVSATIPGPPAIDWNPLFSAADLDLTQFQPAPSQWNSLAASDTRAAWTGKWPGTDRTIRIEAAAFQGKPVFFRLVGDWTQPSRMQAPQDSLSKKAVNLTMVALFTAMLIAALFLARRNYRQGRGDRRGATLLGQIFFAILMVIWLLQGHFVASVYVLGLMVIAISTALFLSGVVFVLYLALEPYVRRYWPQAIISWSRLLSGHMRDPLVGRDALLGVLLGVVWIVIFKIGRVVSMRMGAAPELFSTDYLLSSRRAIGTWVLQFPMAILGTLQFFGVTLVLKLLLKKDWLATIAFVAIFAANKSIGSNYLVVTAVTTVLVYLVLALIVYRFGLVPLTCAIFTVNLLGNVPFTADASVWYFGNSIFDLLSVLALAVWGFYHSLGGEAAWKGNV